MVSLKLQLHVKHYAQHCLEICGGVWCVVCVCVSVQCITGRMNNEEVENELLGDGINDDDAKQA